MSVRNVDTGDIICHGGYVWLNIGFSGRNMAVISVYTSCKRLLQMAGKLKFLVGMTPWLISTDCTAPTTRNLQPGSIAVKCNKVMKWAGGNICVFKWPVRLHDSCLQLCLCDGSLANHARFQIAMVLVKRSQLHIRNVSERATERYVASNAKCVSAGFRTLTYISVLMSDSTEFLICYWKHIFRVLLVKLKI
jgi:hypothetical protein